MEEHLWNGDCAAETKSSTEVSAGGAEEEFGVPALMWPRASPAKFWILPPIFLRLSAQAGIHLGSLAVPIGARTMMAMETLQTWLGADKTSSSTVPNSHFGSLGRICLQQWKARCNNPMPGSAGAGQGMCSNRGVKKMFSRCGKKMFSRCGLSSCSALWEFCEDRG